MIAHLIRWSVRNRFFVLIGMLALVGAGVWAVRSTAIDALPDLSDVQVVIRTSYPGQAPRIVENQVTYPLTTTMLSVPGAKTVRGYSFFGDSFVYVIFEDGTDLYCAQPRARISQSGAGPPAARRAQRQGQMPPAWAGSMNMRWSTDQAATICRNCAAFRTGSCAMN
jgi:Cu(I)/Ag(I) efflux system membrane protein CusA/SilA